MKTTRMQGMCGPGSYCVETKERLNCLCPSGYTYIDTQHSDSGCTPKLEPQSCGEENILTRNRESQRLLSSSVRAFSWKELYQATNGFEKLLGKGSFGEVYKGTIRSPQPHPHLIAVKKLIDSNEVQSIRQIHHRNLVRMIGYCKEGKHRMLVFEFMPGGSLRSVLFNPDPLRPPLPSPGGLSTFTMAAAHRSSIVTSSPTTSCWMTVESRITDWDLQAAGEPAGAHNSDPHQGTRGYIAPSPSGSAATHAWTPRRMCTVSESCCWS
ncbi:hypothetical protein ZWY2020_032152 [Hordeum vulgare]|nr:hypothetical protein ZWY2020_032152 [Hordeum vulgare]